MFDFVKDNAFDIEKTSDYILSIQVSLDGFSFLIAHPEEKKILAFEYSPVKISNEILVARHFKEWIFSKDLFRKNYQKIQIVVFTSEFSLIPETFYHENLVKEIPPVLFGKNEEVETAENFIKKLNSRLIFQLPVGFYELVTQFFGLCEIIHPLKLVLNNLPPLQKKYAMVLLFNPNYFYAVVYEENKILLINNFKMSHTNDVVYFVLNTLGQLKISISDTELFLAEGTKNYSEFENALQPYFEQTGDLKPVSEIRNPEFAGNSFLSNFLFTGSI